MNSVKSDKAYYYYTLKSLQDCLVDPNKSVLKE
jgi:hypothetical protein